MAVVDFMEEEEGRDSRGAPPGVTPLGASAEEGQRRHRQTLRSRARTWPVSALGEGEALQIAPVFQSAKKKLVTRGKIASIFQLTWHLCYARRANLP